MAGDTLGVPGLLNFSTDDAAGRRVRQVGDDGPPHAARGAVWRLVRDRQQRRRRRTTATRPRHSPAQPPRDLRSVEGLFDPDGFRAMSSDIAALLVLSHQMHMMNLLTRIGWEARAADPTLHPPFVAAPGEDERIAQMMSAIAIEVVDYLLFVDEAPLPDRVRGASGFAERFSGPRAARQEGPLAARAGSHASGSLKYPCSYLIYSPAFDALPPAAKDADLPADVGRSCRAASAIARYSTALPLETRRAIVEILRDTKQDLPGYFSLVVSR